MKACHSGRRLWHTVRPIYLSPLELRVGAGVARVFWHHARGLLQLPVRHAERLRRRSVPSRPGRRAGLPADSSGSRAILNLSPRPGRALAAITRKRGSIASSPPSGRPSALSSTPRLGPEGRLRLEERPRLRGRPRGGSGMRRPGGRRHRSEGILPNRANFARYGFWS